MSEIRIAAIVGGHGEVESVPILFRRIAGVVDPRMIVRVERPLRVPENRLAKEGELERHVEFSARRVGRYGGIFILMDRDWPGGCPKNDAPVWLQRAREARRDMEIPLVLANKEYEAWFLAAAESLRDTVVFHPTWSRRQIPRVFVERKSG